MGSSSRDSVTFRELITLLELYSTNWLASNILLLASTKCFLTSQRLAGAGMNCRVLLFGVLLDGTIQSVLNLGLRQLFDAFFHHPILFILDINI
jgi:hypothetical protein